MSPRERKKGRRIMKKLISLVSFIFVVIFLMGSVPAFGEGNWEHRDFREEKTIEKNGFTFIAGQLYFVDAWAGEEEFLGNCAVLKSYSGKDEVVNIPGEVDGYKVYKIEYHAFDNIPAKKVIVPDTVDEMHEPLFVDCKNLETVDLGKVDVYDDSSIVEIGLRYTENCPSFKGYIVSQDNRTFTAIEGALIEDHKYREYNSIYLIEYPEGATRDCYFLPKKVRHTYWQAFNNVKNLKYVSFAYGKMGLASNIFKNSSVVAVMLGKDCFLQPETFDESNVKYVFYKGTKEQWNEELVCYDRHLRSACVKDKDIKVIYNAKDVEKVFTDVSTSAWYRGAAEFAYNAGLMGGVEKDKFAPEGAMTRAMLVAALWRQEGKPKAKGKSPFTDLKQDWYTPAVNWAYEKGIIDGYSKTKFAPDGKLTREQIAAIMYRYAKFKGADVSSRADLSGYSDKAKIHSYAKNAVSWAVAIGIIKGVTAKKLDPRGNATRAQVATILLRQA